MEWTSGRLKEMGTRAKVGTQSAHQCFAFFFFFKFKALCIFNVIL